MQFSIFDGTQKFLSNKPIRLIELFGGISAQATALHELDVEFEHYRYVDFDKYAVKSTNAMYGTNWEETDITKIKASDLGVVETDKYDYIVTYSFPCQDLSLAGKGAGMQKGSGTRSGLLWEVERLLNEMQELPQVLLMENVPQVHGKKNIDNFNEWQDFLQSKGYKNYWQDLKATNFGIPQSRNRTFMVSLLGDYHYSFPKEIKLEYLLKDFLETEVDEKYYLSDKMITTNASSKMDDNFVAELSLKEKLADKLVESGEFKPFDIVNHSFTNNSKKENSRLEPKDYLESGNGIMPTIFTRADTFGVVEPKSGRVKEEFAELQKKVAEEALRKQVLKLYDVIDYTYSNSRLSEIEKGFIKIKNKSNNNVMNTLTANAENFGVVVGTQAQKPICLNSKVDGKQPSLQDRVYDSSAVSTAITTSFHPSYTDSLRIRKLTPRECWRLMGFRDKLFDKAQQVNSNSQLYKQAGNSIVTTVLMAIFGELLGVAWQSKVKNLINDIKE